MTTEEIIRTVAARFGVSVGSILGRSRTKEIVRARHAAMWLSRASLLAGEYRRSYPDIARAFCRGDHTSVMYAVRKVGQVAAEDQEYAMLLSELLQEVERR